MLDLTGWLEGRCIARRGPNPAAVGTPAAPVLFRVGGRTAMHVIEVGLRPSTQQMTEPDGAKRAMILEPAGPPR